MNRNPMDCTAPGSLERAIVIATSAHAGATDKDRARLDRYLAARRLIDQLIGEGPCTT